MKRNSGNALLGVVALLLILAVLAGIGGWNYLRNVRAENQVFRPYRGVSDTELAQLAEAYQGETEQADNRYGAARERAGGVRNAPLLAERVNEFERVRRRSERTRALGARASELGSGLESIREEIRIRETEQDRMALFLRRLLTI